MIDASNIDQGSNPAFSASYFINSITYNKVIVKTYSYFHSCSSY